MIYNCIRKETFKRVLFKMSKYLKNVSPGAAIGFGYKFFFTNLLFCLKYIFPFMLVFIALQSFMPDHSSIGDAPNYFKNIIYDLTLGWALFGISRRVFLSEDLSKMKLSDIFAADRMCAMLITMFVYAGVHALINFSNSYAMDSMMSQGFAKSNMIPLLLFAYFSSMMFVGAFTAIAFAVEGKPLSFLYLSFHPSYLTKVFVIWLMTVMPILGIYYAVSFFVVLGGDFDQITRLAEHHGLVDHIAYGFTTVASFVIFSSAIVSTTKHFIVLKRRPVETPDVQETQGDNVSPVEQGQTTA